MSNVTRLGADLERPMTIGQGLDEIERMRRQIDRFEHLPRKEGSPLLDPEEAAAMKQLLARAEATIHESLQQQST